MRRAHRGMRREPQRRDGRLRQLHRHGCGHPRGHEVRGARDRLVGQPQARTDLVEVGLHLGPRPRRVRRPHHLGRPCALGDVAVGVGVVQDPGADGDVDVGVDLPAVHPQQALRVVEPECAPRGRVVAAQLGVDAPHPPGGGLDLARGAVGADAHELGGAHEAGEGLGRVEQCGVLVGAEHHPRVQGLEDQRPEPAHVEHRLEVDPPRHGVRAEQPGVDVVGNRRYGPHPSSIRVSPGPRAPNRNRRDGRHARS